MNYEDLQSEVNNLNRYLRERKDFVEHIARTLRTQLSTEGVGIPADEIELVQLNDDVNGESLAHPMQLRGEDEEGHVGFGIRFHQSVGGFLSEVAILVKWKFKVGDTDVVATAGDDTEEFTTTIDKPGNGKFVQGLTKKTVQLIVEGLQRMRGKHGINRELGFHRITDNG